MTIKELEKRARAVDDRSIMLFKKYPLVGAAVFLAGLALGLAIGTWVL